MDTGIPAADARDDFSRARRQEALARLVRRLRGGSGGVDVMLPFDEVVAALGRRGERFLGQEHVRLDTIIGSVDRETGFDRMFRPTSSLARSRFERINTALRSGEAMPPVELYRIGEAHFVLDGHHRVAVARSLGWKDINALVTEVETIVGTGADLRMEDLPTKGHERLFHDRVPLPTEWRPEIRLGSGPDYGSLAEGVEAWGFRYMQQVRKLLDRRETAVAWYTKEYMPSLQLLREAGLLDAEHSTESYMRLSTERYNLLMSQDWDDHVLDRLRQDRDDRAGTLSRLVGG